MDPLVGCNSPDINFTNVDLPQPFGPTNATLKETKRKQKGNKKETKWKQKGNKKSQINRGRINWTARIGSLLSCCFFLSDIYQFHFMNSALQLSLRMQRTNGFDSSSRCSCSRDDKNKKQKTHNQSSSLTLNRNPPLNLNGRINNLRVYHCN
jgi:hypothetical protein